MSRSPHGEPGSAANTFATPARRQHWLPRALALVAVLFAHLAPVHAAGLQVTPISLELTAKEQGKTLTLGNSGKTPLRAQVRVLQWTQSGNSDQLLPTREVVASPPTVEIAPGSVQVVRIVRLQPAPAAQEKTYRLIIDELPGIDGAALPQPAQPGLQFLLRYSVPVFVLPSAGPPGVTEPVLPTTANPLSDVSGLSGVLVAESAGAQSLRLVNQGPRRIKLSQLTYTEPGGQRHVLVPGLLGYVLAGQQMQWPIVLPTKVATGGSFKAKFNDDQEEQALPLAPDRR